VKFRPQIQLRFRNVEHYERVKVDSEQRGLSVNEYVLRALEGLVPRVTVEPVRKGVAEQTGSGSQGNTPRGGRGVGKPTPSSLSKSDQLRQLRERNSR
jgi:hypothetical protein